MPKQEQKMVVTKSNKLIDAGFFKRLNSMEMRIVNLAVSQLNPLRSIDQPRRFEFTVKEFLTFNPSISDQNNVYENVKNAVINLAKIWVEVEPLEGYDKTEVSLLTRRSYAKGKGSFMVEFHEDVMPYLSEIKKNYTSYLLENFGQLKSEHSLKLYEILSRYAFQGNVTLTVNSIKDYLDVSDKYEKFYDFNRYVLKLAVKEINSKTNLSVSVKTIRNGRSIEKVTFKVFDKSKAISIDEPKRPKFPHKNKYGRFVKLDTENPKMSSHEYGLWASDCLKILEDFYSKIEDVTLDDLRHYCVFLAVSQSNKSKFGKRSIFIDELKKQGYKIERCELVRL